MAFYICERTAGSSDSGQMLSGSGMLRKASQLSHKKETPG